MPTNTLQSIPLTAILPDPDQPRDLPTLDELLQEVQTDRARALARWQGLRELAVSILDVGLQQPITVYPAGQEGRYTIYDGQRRWTAVQMLHREGQGDGTIMCHVRERPAAQELILGQLNANIQRKSFDVFEMARSLQEVYQGMRRSGGSIRTLRKDGGLDVIELAPGAPDEQIWSAIEARLGISRSRRYQIQAVLRLPDHIQRLAQNAGLPESRLRFVLPLRDPKVMEGVIEAMSRTKMSNAEIKRFIRELQATQASAGPAPMPKPNQIRSAIRPMRQMARAVGAVSNVAGAVSSKDPRTVAAYKKLLPEIRRSIEDLETVLQELAFLEAG